MTAIYHITSIQNLPDILDAGGLWCDRIVEDQHMAHTNIAYPHIKLRRAQKVVQCGPGGVVADYVPFYFAPRSPMLFVINKGGVVGYRGGQSPILHLVSSAEAVEAAGLPFTFTDGHATVEISQYYTDLNRLDQIDWAIMRSIYWNDTFEDGDRSRRRQAEFLVHNFLPFSLIETIGVINQTIARQVNGLLQQLPTKPNIEVVPTWYY
jgi:hypothetical protein